MDRPSPDRLVYISAGCNGGDYFPTSTGLERRWNAARRTRGCRFSAALAVRAAIGRLEQRRHPGWVDEMGGAGASDDLKQHLTQTWLRHATTSAKAAAAAQHHRKRGAAAEAPTPASRTGLQKLAELTGTAFDAAS
jgi:hypothetical protein